MPQSRPSIKQKNNPENGRKFLQIIYLIRDLYLEHTRDSYNSVIKRQPNLEIGKGFEQTFLQRRYTNTPKHMKRCSTSLAIREMQIKTTVRFYYTPTRKAIIKKTGNDKC